MKTMVAKGLFLLLPVLLPMSELWACPVCAGSSVEEKGKMTMYILAGFILLAYIPFLVIFRCIKKYSHFSSHKP